MSDEAVRIDKWLWAARFFKTRSNATEAVAGGHVHVGGERVKPARKVRAGDQLRVRRGHVEWEIIVAGVSDRRGPASEARTLYEETAQSIARRDADAQARKFAAQSGYRGVGNPSRRDRRELDRLKGRVR